MIAVTKLQNAQQTNRSHICLGLDLDPKKMPSANSSSLKGMFDFAHEIIKAACDQGCAYKPNLAFYENQGPDGLPAVAQHREANTAENDQRGKDT